MTVNNQTARELAEILARRASDFPTYVDDLRPEAIARRLVEFNIDAATADAIAWGTLHELGPIDLKRLALAFSLDADVLALFLHPASDDVAERTLTDVRRLMNDDECGACDVLHDRLDFYFANPELDDREPLAAILRDLLSHLVHRLAPGLEDGEPDALYDPDPDPCDDEDETDGTWDDVAPLIGRLLHAFSQIPSRTLQEEIVRSVESAIEPVDTFNTPTAGTEQDV